MAYDKSNKLVGIEFIFDFPKLADAPTLLFNFLENDIISTIGNYSFYINTTIELDTENTIMVGTLCKLDILDESVDNFSFLIHFNKVDLSNIISQSDCFWDLSDIKV